jgi:putative transposase
VPRRLRSHLGDGTFHVTARGTGGIFVFLDDVDRQVFVSLLQHVSERFVWRVDAWCLMGTHFHLLVEATREQLSASMHLLNTIYAQRFNRRHGRRGHLFEERFASWLIEDEPHMEATIAYILENPVRAGLCDDARDWVWSWSRYENPTARLVAAAVRTGAPGTVPGTRRKKAGTVLRNTA